MRASLLTLFLFASFAGKNVFAFCPSRASRRSSPVAPPPFEEPAGNPAAPQHGLYQPPSLGSSHHFGSTLRLLSQCFATKKKGKLSSKERRRRDSEKQKRWNAYQDQQKKRRRMNNLHKAAKMKRILSAVDYWFSPGNLCGDSFLWDELRAHGGRHVRITTLASFDKLAGWTSPELIRETLASAAAQKRYRVVHNRALVEAAIRNTQRQKKRGQQEDQQEEQQGKLDRQQAKRQRTIRRRQLKRYLEETRTAYFRIKWKELKRQWEEEDKQEIAEAEAEQERVQAQSNMTEEERHAYEDSRSEEWWRQVALKELDQKTGDDHEDDEMDWYYYEDLGFEEDLMMENEEFEKAIEELEEIEQDELLELNQLSYESHIERLFQPRGPSKQELEQKKKEQAWYGHIQIETDDDLMNEELPDPVQDDESNLIEYALVQPKRVDQFNSNYGVDEDVEDGWENGYRGHHVLLYNEDLPFEEDEEEPTQPRKKPKRPNLPKYKSEREVYIVRKDKQLQSFCKRLRDSMDRSKSHAVGFDVEYCSLDIDIRGNLPAMLQLASPEPDGPVGLIWLDKFPNHGKDMIGRQHEKPGHKELFSILGDSSIAKVGVGSSLDARNLVAWWGMTDPGYADYYVCGLVDLEDEVFSDQVDPQLDDDSLKDLCTSVLQKNLPKIKEKNRVENKAKRKAGYIVKTSHWRRDDLTKEMKIYAADDASASIDIWLHLQQQLEADGDSEG